MLECAVGALAAVKRAVANDQAAGGDSLTIRYAGKVDGMLDVLKGVLAGTSLEKLYVVISHAETEKKRDVHATKDSRWAPMGRSWCDVVTITPPVRQGPLEWDAICPSFCG